MMSPSAEIRRETWNRCSQNWTFLGDSNVLANRFATYRSNHFRFGIRMCYHKPEDERYNPTIRSCSARKTVARPPLRHSMELSAGAQIDRWSV